MTIAQAEDLRAFSLPRLDTEAMGYADVIVIPQIAGTVEFFNQARPAGAGRRAAISWRWWPRRGRAATPC